MALVGTLSTMPLPDLLQWVGNARKSGTLHVERNKVSKRIVFRDGRVISCSTDEPSELLGHFLVSRGKIDEGTQHEALQRQERTRKHLGAILVDMKALSSEELTRHLAAKAEETIFSLFDVDEAVFRFHDDELPDEIDFPLDLRVDDVLLRGMQRLDEVRRIRTVFNDPGIVLSRTDKRAPPELTRNRMARSIYDIIDGKRTVADILLLFHASEYLITKFLFELFRNGLVEVGKVRSVEAGADSGPPTPEVTPAADSSDGPAADGAPAAATTGSETTTHDESTLERDLNVAATLVSRGEYDAALEILNTAYRAKPDDQTLGKLLAEAEAAFIEKAYRHYLPPHKIPVLLAPQEDLVSERMTPAEFFLLSRIDGSWSVKSIIQISPIREVVALRTLKRMRDRGVIDLRDPD